MKLKSVWRSACAGVATFAAGAFAAGMGGATASAQVLLSDNFNTAASSANYVAVSTDPTSSFATFAYDYSVMGIPSAPNSGGGSTLGVKLDANFSAPGAAEGLTLHTVGSSRVDLQACKLEYSIVSPK